MSRPASPPPARSSALEAMQEEEALGRAYDLRLLRRLWPFVRPYRLQVVLTLVLVLPLFLLEIAPAWIIKTGLDRVSGAAPVGGAGIASGAGRFAALDALLDPPPGWSAIGWLSLLYLVVAALNSGLHYLHAYVMTVTGQSAMRDLRRRVFDQIQRLHLGFFDRYPVGRLVTRATNDVENVAEMFSAGIVALLTDVFKMVGFAVVLFLLDARLAGLTFLVVPPMALAAMVFRFQVRQAYRLIRVRIARINAYLQENVSGMREVQLFGREARNAAEFEAMNASHRDAWILSIRYDAALFSVVELASNLTFAILFWQASGVASAGAIYVFIDLMRRFFMPLRELTARYSVMQSSMASAERIFQLLDVEPGVRDRADVGAAAPLPFEAAPAIEFDRVWFRYDGSADAGADDPGWVLRDVSLRIGVGEKAALVGPTGAGKTTLLALLLRFYEPTRGCIRVGGIDLRELPQVALRRRIAMVLQDVFLFSGSIADNIGLERSEISREAIRAACRAVQADRFIEALPEGIDSEVRERGANFSSGQRQLLSFARALAHGAPILALDEATSSIDPETEALVQEGVRRLMAGRSALVVAHRLSTIRDVDRIHVLQGGRIVESGSHAELLARGGAYAEIYRLQYAAQDARTGPGSPP